MDKKTQDEAVGIGLGLMTQQAQIETAQVLLQAGDDRQQHADDEGGQQIGTEADSRPPLAGEQVGVKPDQNRQAIEGHPSQGGKGVIEGNIQQVAQQIQHGGGLEFPPSAQERLP